MAEKPIVFIDFADTICSDRFGRTLPPAEFKRFQRCLVVENRAMADAWMRGVYTAQEVLKHLSQALAVPYEPLWKRFVHEAKTMHVDPIILKKIRALRARYRAVLMTVNTDSFSEFTVPALNLADCFDGIVNSYDVGRFKHEDGGSLFSDYAHAVGTSIEAAYLIDDSVQNCAVFRGLGGIACLVTADAPAEAWLDKLLAGRL